MSPRREQESSQRECFPSFLSSLIYATAVMPEECPSLITPEPACLPSGMNACALLQEKRRVARAWKFAFFPCLSFSLHATDMFFQFVSFPGFQQHAYHAARHCMPSSFFLVHWRMPFSPVFSTHDTTHSHTIYSSSRIEKGGFAMHHTHTITRVRDI